MKFRDIPQFTRTPSYRVNVDWRHIESVMKRYADIEGNIGGLDLDPDFQRAHVWTPEQQIKYVEFILRGGTSSREIIFNAKGWMRTFKGKVTIVDGKQRLQAARQFLANEIPAFGHFYREYTDMLKADFIFCINDLETRKEVLQWYLDLNTGGTIHTDEEIEKVRRLLASELREM